METLNEGVSSKLVLSRLDSLEDHSRRNNLHFKGIQEHPNETWEHIAERVQKLVKDKLRVSENVSI